MLLCCFKEPKRKASLGEDETYTQPLQKQQQQQLQQQPSLQQKRQSLISTSSVSSFGAPAPLISNGLRPPPLRDRRGGAGGKERAPLQKEEKRMIKQRSHDSFRLQEANSMPYIDQSPPIVDGTCSSSGAVPGSGRNSAMSSSNETTSPHKLGKTEMIVLLRY